MSGFFDTLEPVLNADYAGTAGGPRMVLVALLLAFVLGHIVAWVYMWTHTGLSYSLMFTASLLVMPILVAIFMMLVASNAFIALGMLAVLTKNEFTLVICGGIFVMEALSVIIQVASFKTTGRRVFKMAPIHHHFEQLGWTEPQVVIRFWIVAVVLALVGLSTLKLR